MVGLTMLVGEEEDVKAKYIKQGEESQPKISTCGVWCVASSTAMKIACSNAKQT